MTYRKPSTDIPSTHRRHNWKNYSDTALRKNLISRSQGGGRPAREINPNFSPADLKRWRKERYMTQLELALILGVNQATISHWENSRERMREDLGPYLQQSGADLIRDLDGLGAQTFNEAYNRMARARGESPRDLIEEFWRPAQKIL